MIKTLTDDRIEGYFEVCAHRVVYRYWGFPEDFELTDDELQRLEAAAEERAKVCIIEGYYAGQLCESVRLSDETEHELSGWWEIDRG